MSSRVPAEPSALDAPVENIVFDMGGVLLNFDGLYFARHYTRTEEDARIINDALFNRPEWTLIDAGAISYETMRRIAAASVPERLLPALNECFEHWTELSAPFLEVNDLAIQLKSDGYGIYLLSNAGLHISEQLRNLPVFPYLDGWMASAFERIMKPDPAIYGLFCGRFGLNPATCLFVDDNPNNCAGARAAGMHALHYTGDVDAIVQAINELA